LQNIGKLEGVFLCCRNVFLNTLTVKMLHCKAVSLDLRNAVNFRPRGEYIASMKYHRENFLTQALSLFASSVADVQSKDSKTKKTQNFCKWLNCA